MCCLVLVAGIIGPRVAVLVWWIFGDKVDVAFDTWVWPLLGLLFLPWTTLAYLIVWSPIVGVDGGEWIIVALGFVADVLTYTSRAAAKRYQRPAPATSGSLGSGAERGVVQFAHGRLELRRERIGVHDEHHLA